MNAVFYMLRKTVKNEILDTLRHPLKLLIYGFMAVTMVYAVISGFFSSDEWITDNRQDIRLLYGAYLVLLHVISVPIMQKGFSTGTSFFSMADVNNVFTAPISDKKILLYGIGRQLASMLFLAISFSAYGSIAVGIFDLTVQQSLMLVGGILLMLFAVQFITLFFYCICSGHPRRASVLKYFVYMIPVYSIFVVLAYVFSRGFTYENLLAAVSQPILDFTPIVGWMHGFVLGLLSGAWLQTAVYGGLLLISFSVSIVVFAKIKLDFYEDVLSQAESYFEFRDSIRTGRMSENVMLGSRKINVRKTGINRGHGAAAVFFKHLKEGSRRSRFMFFNINTVVLLSVSLLVGKIIQDLPMFEGATGEWLEMKPTIIYLAVTVICAYVQFFFSAAGDWVKELNKHYIFLIPDSAVKKLIMAGATSIIKPFVDGLIAFGALYIIAGGNMIDAVTSMISYGSFGCVYIAANILAQRIVGGSGNGGVFITFYMSFIVLLMIPGIILGVVSLANFGAAGFFSISATLMAVPVFLWNFIISLCIFLLCRNLLNNIA